MDVNLNALLKMPPEMSKIAFYFCFFPQTQAFEFDNKRRYYFCFLTNFVLHGTLEKRYFSIWIIIVDVTKSDWTKNKYISMIIIGHKSKIFNEYASKIILGRCGRLT